MHELAMSCSDHKVFIFTVILMLILFLYINAIYSFLAIALQKFARVGGVFIHQFCVD